MRECWIEACRVDDIEPEDVIRFDYEAETYAIYRDGAGMFYATAGLCTHERAHLADGLVSGDLIECPKHNGRFDYRTGKATRVPVSVDLRTYDVRVDGGRVLINID